MPLRPYQIEAVEAVEKAWEEARSTLVVMPTGTGKTSCFVEIVNRNQSRGRALILAHREELIFQAAERFRQFGMETEIEMADQFAQAGGALWAQSSVVISTVQSQISKGRKERFNPMDFSIIVTDEAQHAVSKSWSQVVNYYMQNPNARLCGWTATPDRADEEALGKVFETVAYEYDILRAINDGWLVRIDQRMVRIEGLDFSAMRTTAGDLNGADLAGVMEAEQNLLGVASAVLQVANDKRTLVFTASVAQAERLAEIFNRHEPGRADFVSGKTPKDERREKLQWFGNGKRIICNCGVLNEGYDNPGIEVVVQARPTKSRSLYTQICGRGTRPLPDLVDGIESAEDRRAAIAASEKPAILILDFCGNAGRHKLISTADILGGNMDDAVIERAKKRAEKEGEKGKQVDMTELLRQEAERIKAARLAEAARRAQIKANAKFSIRTVSPFDVFDIEPGIERGWDRGKSLSEKQRNLLIRQGVDPEGIPYHAAQRLIGEFKRRWDNNLCTISQAALLRKFLYNPKDITFNQAHNMIEAVKANGWRRPIEPPKVPVNEPMEDIPF